MVGMNEHIPWGAVDRDSHQKLYVQIYEILRRVIEDGGWQVDGLIPSEDELCRHFMVSKATVRLAIAELVRNGYLKRQQGCGTFVRNNHPDPGMTIRTRFGEDLFGGGVRLDRTLVSHSVGTPQGAAETYLHGEPKVLHGVFRGTIQGEPVCCEDIHIACRRVPGIERIDLTVQPFFDAIQKLALQKIMRVVQTVSIVAVPAEIAKFFRVKPGANAISVSRLFIDAHENVIAFSQLIGKNGRYRIQNEFERCH